jgi:threonine dehydratase
VIDPVAAASALAGVVRRTPTIAVERTDLGLAPGAPIEFKLEYLQHSGTFKARGASHFMVRNPIGDAGVVAASGGNHGAAVAWAARERGHAANIFVPTISSPAKVDRLRSYGATVHQVGAVYSESLDASIEFQASTGATGIHAYDHPDVMAGAGTTTLEFVEQVDGLDTVLLACGGGGLSGGAAHAVGSSTRLVVCEGVTTNAYAAAVEAGEPVDVTVSGVTADALGATRIGGLAWDALSGVDALSALVTDDAVLAARQALWSVLRIVVEPAVATTVAALMAGAYEPHADERVGVVLCGANTRLDDLT